MAIGLYVHIPFCIQQCPYCDFSTEINQEENHEDYIEQLKKEIAVKSNWAADKNVRSLYFGGGTPSLVQPKYILSLIKEFEKYGFNFLDDVEITLEINPGTISEDSLGKYLEMGINRFSVGAQSFNDKILNKIGRKHSSEDTVITLDLLNKHKLNYSFDLLFSLPDQSMHELALDLASLNSFSPKHISTYYLTIPQKHPLNQNRPNEDTELEMFDFIEDQLNSFGFNQYEISNHSKEGFESKHNYHTWLGGQYLGVGMSAHSYLEMGGSKYRFWNPNTTQAWKNSLRNNLENMKIKDLPNSRFEILSKIDQLNDSVHTGLRLKEGFSEEKIISQLSMLQLSVWKKEIDLLIRQNYLLKTPNVSLSRKGKRMLNFVLEKLFISE
ncbi:MAG: radical SAM family heme chaperone HemW [Bdellovibrionota bacterium]|nr:radical SAM family heme chaperone HemW [Bdellovibrionota bacterium]